MIEQIKQKLIQEVEQLNHELNVLLPETLMKALQQGDLRENGDYHAALERQQFVHARLSHLRSRLAKLSQIDLSKIPKDKIGLGSRVEVQDAETKERETYELVIPDAMDVDAGHISVASPLGRGLLDHKAGETVTIRLPATTRRLKILKVVTQHQQVSEDG
ncbi:MAG: GreA/GreB family elongation factor [Gemmatimonadetes bacterium]|nr:GreA/GreB family elongation factor [Gemmatimonadota bacterium]MBI2537587.1 GreA/GreB family elongation factor [Gemmatimonadota bacterium]MBI2616313.1 GreA/GreB family elongation factor [Gemmatimonadota bacterium]